MIVVQYDPYKQTANFKYKKDDGSLSELKGLKRDQSDAMEKLKTDIVLQNQIENLVSVLQNIYGKRLQLEFVGTEKDYKALAEGIAQIDPDVFVSKADTPFLYEPDFVREKIVFACTDVMKQVSQLNNEYPEYASELCFDSTGVDAALNDRTPIVFMGSGSAGKSSVINALIGAEVLPTGDGTTTEAVYEIIPSDCFEVSFKADEELTTLDLNKQKSILEQDAAAIFGGEMSLTSDNPYDWVYLIVSKINDMNTASEIRIKVPFKNLKSISAQIVLYDTPGPDSRTRDHKQVLNKALYQFKKGIAVFVTRRTEIEKTTLRDFLKRYTENHERISEILNVNAGIVLINGADESTIEKIQQGKESRKKHLAEIQDNDVKKEFAFEQDRMIYFSSPYALGVNKSSDDAWMDSGFKKLNKDRYRIPLYDPNDEDYIPLATVAELPVIRKTAVLQAYKAAEKSYKDSRNEDDQRELIAHNSGLRAVEYELNFIVKELSICNLCAQAQKQLQAVLEAIANSIQTVETSLNNKQEEHRALLDSTYRAIKQKLDSIKDECKRNGKQRYAPSPDEKEETASISAAKAAIKQYISDNWKTVKQDPVGIIKKTILNNPNVVNIEKNRQEKARSAYQSLFTDFKEDCRKAVLDDLSLSEEERKILDDCISRLSPVPYDEKKAKIEVDNIEKNFLMIKWKDKNRAIDEAIGKLSRLLAAHALQVSNNWTEQVNANCDKILEQFYNEKRIKEINPELQSLQEAINHLTEQMGKYRRFETTVTEYQIETEQLTVFHRKEEADI